MNEKQMIWLLVLGLIPYKVERRSYKGGRRTWKIEALFWQLAFSTYRRRRNWEVQVPLITRLRDVVWAAVMELKK